MKARNRNLRLYARITDYEKTIEGLKTGHDGYHKPGADADSFGHQGPGKKVNRIKRTQDTHQRLRDLAKRFPENPDLRRYL